MDNNQSHLSNQEWCWGLKIAYGAGQQGVRRHRVDAGSSLALERAFTHCFCAAQVPFLLWQPCLAYISLRDSNYWWIRKDYRLLTANELLHLLHCRKTQPGLAVILKAKWAGEKSKLPPTQTVCKSHWQRACGGSRPPQASVSYSQCCLDLPLPQTLICPTWHMRNCQRFLSTPRPLRCTQNAISCQGRNFSVRI